MKIILKWILDKYGVCKGVAKLTWLRIGTGGGLL
jgi:hypothetical protein